MRKKASADGKDLQVFILETLETKALKPSLDEILTPVRQDFDESGMSEDDLNVFIVVTLLSIPYEILFELCQFQSFAECWSLVVFLYMVQNLLL